jgi:hypothetical protein
VYGVSTIFPIKSSGSIKYVAFLSIVNAGFHKIRDIFLLLFPTILCPLKFDVEKAMLLLLLSKQ